MTHEMQGCRPLFVETPDGGYVFPQYDYIPGVFVEECKPGENIKPLTCDEIADVSIAIDGCTWHCIGFEAGREYYKASFKANVFDAGILCFSKWKLCEYQPDDSYRKWAIEFPLCNKIVFVRRYFWFQSKHHVPEDENSLIKNWRAKRKRANRIRQLPTWATF